MTPPLTMAEQRAVERAAALYAEYAHLLPYTRLRWVLERLVEDLREAHGIKAGPA